jgi:hypothetical protein
MHIQETNQTLPILRDVDKNIELGRQMALRRDAFRAEPHVHASRIRITVDAKYTQARIVQN